MVPDILSQLQATISVYTLTTQWEPLLLALAPPLLNLHLKVF